MIAERLAGKRIAITGSTGFVGTALVERLLRAVPGCELVLHTDELSIGESVEKILALLRDRGIISL